MAVAAGLAVAVRRRSPAPDQGVALRWAAVGAAALLAAMLGADPLLSLLGDSVRVYGVATTVVVIGAFWVGAASGDRLRPLVVALLMGAALVVGYGVMRMMVVGWSPRPVSTMGNPAFLGGYLALALPMAASTALTKDRLRVLGVAVFGIGALVMVATRTRGAWIGAAAGVAVVLAAHMPRRARVWVTVAGVGLAVAAALAVDVGSRGSGIDLSSGTGRGRVDTWANTVPAVAERPLIGWGPEGFRRAFGRSVDAEWVRTYSLDQIPDRAHNRFLDVAVSAGIIGLAADVALVLAGIALCRARLRVAAGADAPFVAGIVGGLLGWLVQGLFLFDTFDLAVIAAVLLGALATGGQTARWRVPLAIATAVVVAAVAIPGFVADRMVATASTRDPHALVRRLIAAARVRPRSLDTHLLIADVAVRSRDIAVLERAHRFLAGWDDDDVRLADADLLSRLGRLANRPSALIGAASAYNRVLGVQPNNGLAWLGLGETLARQRDIAGARAAFERAYHLLPDSPFPSLDLALIALSGGRHADACSHLRDAERVGGRRPEVADLRRRVEAATAC